jgi:SAM-dependent methyltransferase
VHWHRLFIDCGSTLAPTVEYKRCGLWGLQMNDDEWFNTLCRSVRETVCGIDGAPLPTFPPDALQIATVGAAGEAALREAWTFAVDCTMRFRSSPRWHAANKTLLDFGVGWGRITRCFLRDFQSRNLVGIDVDGNLLSICREAFGTAQFLLCDPFPPSELKDQSIDFIVGYSVFSHLSEAACLAWMQEFARLLRPGGMIALTTRGRWFFDRAESLKAFHQDPHCRMLAGMFDDFAQAKARYDRGEFVHANIGGGGVRGADFYGETFIPEGYARTAYSTQLTFLEFFKGLPGGHPIMFFKKPGHLSA